MMNRGVLSRQMFAKGGAAFPDLNKDGEITQADILIGRGVEFKQEGGAAGEARARTIETLAKERGLTVQELLNELLIASLGKDDRVTMGESQRLAQLLPMMRDTERNGRTIAVDGKVIDVTDPESPQVVFGRPEQKTMRQVDGKILDITDPENPRIVFGRPERTMRQVDGQIIDVTDPENPKTVFGAKDFEKSFRETLDQSLQSLPVDMPPVGMAMGGEPGIAQGIGALASEQLDPQAVEQMMMAASQTTGDLEGAQDFEQMMNMVRGDDASVGERREELAGVVGSEDAMQTPESVLALVQPVMQIAAVDQGIGELAQQEMQQPMEGPMAQGIMENVAPPEPMGGPPPVNFKDGGLVRRGDNQPVQKFQFGGTDYATLLSGTVGDLPGQRFRQMRQDVLLDNIDAAQEQAALEAQAQIAARGTAALGTEPGPKKAQRGDGSRLRELMEAQRDIYREYGLGDPAARAAEREDQRKMTQAQMLFDIANTALTFAAPMQGERAGLSPAERLAMAATQTQLPQTIGARAQAQLEADRASKKEERTLDLAALQSAETKLAAEVAAEDARKLAVAKEQAKRKTVTVKGQVIDITNPAKPVVIFGEKDRVLKEVDGQIVDFTNPDKPQVLYGQADKDTVTVDGQVVDISDLNNPKVVFGKPGTKTTTVNGQIIDITDTKNPFVVFGKPDVRTATVKGQIIDITDPSKPSVIFGDKDREIRTVEGQIIDITDPQKPEVLFGDPERDTAMVNGQLIDYTDMENPRVIFGREDSKTTTVKGQVIDITDTANPRVIFGDRDRKTVTLEGQVLDITDPGDVKVLFGDKKRDIRIVKGELVEVRDGSTVPIFGERTPLTGTFDNMILKTGENIIVKKVGETLYDTNGDIIDLSTDRYQGAVLTSRERAFSESKLAGSMAAAAQELRIMDQQEGDDEVYRVVSGAAGLGMGAQDTILEMPTNTATAERTFDALKAARDGVGFYPKIKQVLSESVGGIIPAFEDFGATEVEAGNFIDALNVLGRVALASSPRFAEGEQQRLANLFPSTDRFLANPANAVRRLVGLKRLMQQERKNNLQILASETDTTIRRQAKNQNYAIDGVLKLLEAIPDRGFVDEGAFQNTLETIRRRREERGGS